MVRPAQHVVTGGTGHSDPASFLPGIHQNMRRPGQVHHIVRQEGKGSSTAVPVGHLNQLDTEGCRGRQERVLEAYRFGLEGAAWKIKNLHGKPLHQSDGIFSEAADIYLLRELGQFITGQLVDINMIATFL